MIGTRKERDEEKKDGWTNGRTSLRHLHQKQFFAFFGLRDVCRDEWVLHCQNY